jgi:hypothetical protein
MNLTDTIVLLTGLIQFAVAGYALRLDRMFGVKRVGWSLFWAFFLMALLHLVQTWIPDGGAANLSVTVNVMYALISLLLLISMAHLESLLRERTRVEREEKRLRTELEWEVQKKTAYLTRAIEELQAEIDGRRQAEDTVQITRQELRAAARKLESAELSASVLRSVANALKSVNASAGLLADRVNQSKIANVVHLGALIREQGTDLARFMTQDPRGRKLPVYIAALGRQLAEERIALAAELEAIRRNIEPIKELLATQQPGAEFTRSPEPGADISLAAAARQLPAVAIT